jgi:hypothetical protein
MSCKQLILNQKTIHPIMQCVVAIECQAQKMDILKMITNLKYGTPVC